MGLECLKDIDGDEAFLCHIRINYLATGIAVIHDFCVLPAYPGKGLGGEILGAAVKLLLAQRKVQVRLGVVTHNRRALNLYLRAGFEISAESPLLCDCGGQNLIYIKSSLNDNRPTYGLFDRVQGDLFIFWPRRMPVQLIFSLPSPLQPAQADSRFDHADPFFPAAS